MKELQQLRGGLVGEGSGLLVGGGGASGLGSGKGKFGGFSGRK